MDSQALTDSGPVICGADKELIKLTIKNNIKRRVDCRYMVD